MDQDYFKIIPFNPEIRTDISGVKVIWNIRYYYLSGDFEDSMYDDSNMELLQCQCFNFKPFPEKLDIPEHFVKGEFSNTHSGVYYVVIEKGLFENGRTKVDDVFDPDLDWGLRFTMLLNAYRKYGWSNTILQDRVADYNARKLAYFEEHIDEVRKEAKQWIKSMPFEYL